LKSDAKGGGQLVAWAPLPNEGGRGECHAPRETLPMNSGVGDVRVGAPDAAAAGLVAPSESRSELGGGGAELKMMACLRSGDDATEPTNGDAIAGILERNSPGCRFSFLDEAAAARPATASCR